MIQFLSGDGPVAQGLERQPFKLRVEGSNPSRLTDRKSAERRFFVSVDVWSSDANPLGSTAKRQRSAPGSYP